MATPLKIEILVDDKGSVQIRKFSSETEKATEKASAGFNKTGNSIDAMSKKFISAYAVIAAAYKTLDLTLAAVKAASALEEASSKFSVVFAGMEAQAESWARTLVGSYAMSERESKQYLSSLQDLLVPMGMAADQAGEMSFEITKLAADLGSFNNQPTAKVMDDIQSALVGNYETMKKYGAVLNESTVQQEALRMGLAATKDEITASDKATAAYQLILKSSAAAVGDMARTMDSHANRVKQYSASMEGLSAAIGEILMPWMDKLIVKATEVADSLLIMLDPLKASSMSQVEDAINQVELEIAKFKGVLSGDDFADKALSWMPGYITQNEALLGLAKAEEMLGTLKARLAELEGAGKNAGDTLKTAGSAANKTLEDTADAALTASSAIADLAESLREEAAQAALMADAISSEEYLIYQMMGEIDAAVEATTEAIAKSNASAVTESKAAAAEISKEYEHMLERVQGHFADTFYDIFNGQLRTFDDYLDTMKDMFLRFLAELAAKAFMTSIVIPITAGTASAGGIADLFGGGASAGTGILGMLTSPLASIGKMFSGLYTAAAGLPNIFGNLAVQATILSEQFAFAGNSTLAAMTGWLAQAGNITGLLGAAGVLIGGGLGIYGAITNNESPYANTKWRMDGLSPSYQGRYAQDIGEDTTDEWTASMKASVESFFTTLDSMLSMLGDEARSQAEDLITTALPEFWDVDMRGNIRVMEAELTAGMTEFWQSVKDAWQKVSAYDTWNRDATMGYIALGGWGEMPTYQGDMPTEADRNLAQLAEILTEIGGSTAAVNAELDKLIMGEGDWYKLLETIASLPAEMQALVNANLPGTGYSSLDDMFTQLVSPALADTIPQLLRESLTGADVFGVLTDELQASIESLTGDLMRESFSQFATTAQTTVDAVGKAAVVHGAYMQLIDDSAEPMTALDAALMQARTNFAAVAAELEKVEGLDLSKMDLAADLETYLARITDDMKTSVWDSINAGIASMSGSVSPLQGQIDRINNAFETYEAQLIQVNASQEELNELYAQQRGLIDDLVKSQAQSLTDELYNRTQQLTLSPEAFAQFELDKWFADTMAQIAEMQAVTGNGYVDLIAMAESLYEKEKAALTAVEEVVDTVAEIPESMTLVTPPFDDAAWQDIQHAAEVAAGLWSDFDQQMYNTRTRYDDWIAQATALGASEDQLKLLRELQADALMDLINAESLRYGGHGQTVTDRRIIDQAGIDDVLYQAGVMAGTISDYEQALKSTNEQFLELIDTAKTAGASEETLKAIREFQTTAIKNLTDAENERIRSLRDDTRDVRDRASYDAWNDITHAAEVAAGLWSDADLALYDLNARFDDYITKARELGKSEADITTIENLRIAAIEKLTTVQEENTEAMMDAWAAFGQAVAQFTDAEDSLRAKLQGAISGGSGSVVQQYYDWLAEMTAELSQIPKTFLGPLEWQQGQWVQRQYANPEYAELEALLNQAKAVKWQEVKDNFTKPLLDIINSGGLDDLNAQMAELADWYKEQASLAEQLGESDLLAQALDIQARQIIDDYLKPINNAWQSFLDATTMGNLAPVQSLETFAGRYSDLMAQAQGGNAQAFQDLLSFTTSQYLPFLQGYGGDYADLVSSITQQLDAVRQDLVFTTMEQSMATVVDRLGTGSPLYGILSEIRDGLTGGGSGGSTTITLQVDGRTLNSVIISGLRSDPELIRAIRETVGPVPAI